MAIAFLRTGRTRIAPAALAEAFRLGDALAVMLCVTFGLMRWLEAPLMSASLAQIAPFFGAGVALAWMLSGSGAYRWVSAPERALSAVLLATAGYGATAALCSIAVAAALGAGDRLMAVADGLWTGVFCVIALHGVYWLIRRRLNANGALRERLAVVGVTDTAARLIARASATGEAEIIGVFHDRESIDMRTLSGAPIVGDLMDLLAWPHLSQVDRVVVCLDPLERTRLAAVLARLIALPHPVALAMETPRFGDAVPGVTLAAGMPMAILSGAAGDGRQDSAKRLIDWLGAMAALLALAPFLVTAYLLLRAERLGPALHREWRYGRYNMAFQAVLFRSDSALGRALRSMGLNGLPLLWNVARGDMAIVGPQGRGVGLTVDGIDPFTRFCDYAYRHRVKPGLTGLAQVNGLHGDGGLHGLEAALRFDLDYVRGHDLWLDLAILLRTLPGAIGGAREAR
jgi:polysaccharide biosynthesis protein PslA